jgi:hypothetical protein
MTRRGDGRRFDSVMPDVMSVGRAVAVAATRTAASQAWCGEERANFFDDPFLQVTSGIAGCPVPQGPTITVAEMRAQTHYRSERGFRCFQSGQCRLPNAYMYDKEIIPRVKKAIDFDGHFADTSVWVEGQRRWVFLKGCVRREADAQALEKLVRKLDDVEAVVNQLTVYRR